jgi:hypothetical protein
MNHFDPDIVRPDGAREIASWYYPLMGPYDSADPAALEAQVLLMKLAGIDGVIADWYGVDAYADYVAIDQRTAALLTFAEKAGLRFCLCYEDRTIKAEIEGGFIRAEDAIQHARQAMVQAESRYFAGPAYLRWQGRPVLLNFGPQYFKTSAEWEHIFAVLNPTNQPAFFTVDHRLSAGVGAFSWPPMWLAQGNDGVLSVSQLTGYLDEFERKAATPPSWPAFISSAFPRFHDIYQQAGVSSSYGYLADRDGDTFRETLSRAMTNNSAMIQIVTWNDFGEGTVIEPTREFGFRDLAIVQDLRRRYLEPTFVYGTNDLAVATRLLALRLEHSSNAILSAELDRVFQNAVSDKLAIARHQLAGMESGHPVVYGLSYRDGHLRFVIGGYLPAAGLQVESAPYLTSPLWDVVRMLPVGVSAIEFNAPILPGSASRYFRIAEVAEMP